MAPRNSQCFSGLPGGSQGFRGPILKNKLKAGLFFRLFEAVPGGPGEGQEKGLKAQVGPEVLGVLWPSRAPLSLLALSTAPFLDLELPQTSSRKALFKSGILKAC